MILQTTVKDTNTTEYIAIYCRTACTGENAIESQKARLRHSAIEKGFSPEQILLFIDNGFSGVDLERPGVKNLLNEVREQPIGCVLVVNGDRIARKPDLAIRFVDEVEAAGAKVYTAQDNNWCDLGLELAFYKHDIFQMEFSPEVYYDESKKRRRTFKEWIATLLKGGAKA